MLPTRSHHNTIAKLVLSLAPILSQAIPIEVHPIKRLLASDILDIPSVPTEEPLSRSQFYIYAITSSTLVILGGVFAGLTIGLMGQDEVYLKVISSSGTESEKKCSKKVLQLLDRGKHWLLVTLLLSNVITNETLPVILDRLFGGGLVAVFSSTVAIVIFGEIIPQSICVRYGLELGAFFAPYVLVLMYIMYPVAYPIAKLLDHILGQDHGTLYRKSGLKSLVTLHHTMGTERLNIDEVTIISAVLDLKAKPVSEIMTPIQKVYTLPSDRILDEETIDEIFNAGFSRIPIHFPGEPYNFVGMLLVRILISYDPEDSLPISSFPLATLPETSLNTSCLNILNYFQEGKSHMVVVSETPGKDTGAKGILTLEDVIEELIGEEIVDETDVYIDVNKKIKREIPGPLSKRNINSYLHHLYKSSSKRSSIDNEERRSLNNGHPTYITKDSYKNGLAAVKPAMKPSNLAADPLKTSNTHIKIKKLPDLLTPQGMSPNIPSAIASHSKPNERDSLSPGKTLSHEYGTSSVGPLVNNGEVPKVLNSEAAALVHGIYDNASRHTDKCESRENCEFNGSPATDAAKRLALNASYGIPVPKNVDPRDDHSDDNNSRSGSTGGILVEDNIVSLKGVNKTIIHDGTWNMENV